MIRQNKISRRINHPYLDIKKCHKIKMSKYLVYVIISKTTCDCLTWIVLYKELY